MRWFSVNLRTTGLSSRTRERTASKLERCRTGSPAGASGPGATFRADIVALDALTGHILWQSYSVPDNGGVAGGYAGATMFSAPTVDLADGLVFGTFGQPYTEPASVVACNAAAPGGEFRLATDDPVYLAWALMVMQRHAHQFEWLAERPADFLEPPGGWIETRYGAKSRREGRRPYYLRYVRV